MHARRGTLRVIAAVVGVVAALGSTSTAGAVGEIGRFVSKCKFSHESRNDPIALPRVRGRAHLHHFFGSTSTNARSTARKLRRHTETTCTSDDRAAYWIPALSVNERVIRPDVLLAYYSTAKKDPRTIQAPPKGLKAIAGNGSAITPQDPAVTNWTYAAGLLALAVYPASGPSCDRGFYVVLSVVFPDCWDGVHLNSSDHQSHLAYSEPPGLAFDYRQCPASHPVPIAQLQLRVIYPTSGADSGVKLSSGGIYSGHADFINAWPQAKLEAIVDNCLRAAVNCARRPPS